MTRSELIAELHYRSIPTSAYSLDGPGSGECYCLEVDMDGWKIYYSERGQRHSVINYPTEQEANEKILLKLSSAFRK